MKHFNIKRKEFFYLSNSKLVGIARINFHIDDDYSVAFQDPGRFLSDNICFQSEFKGLEPEQSG